MCRLLKLRPQTLGYLSTEALSLSEGLHNCGGYRYAILVDNQQQSTSSCINDTAGSIRVYVSVSTVTCDCVQFTCGSVDMDGGCTYGCSVVSAGRRRDSRGRPRCQRRRRPDETGSLTKREEYLLCLLGTGMLAWRSACGQVYKTLT